jgi:signal transduction histidine kinase
MSRDGALASLTSRVRDDFRLVRVRATAGAVLVVGVALVVAAVAMVALLRRSLTADVRASALLSVPEVQQQIDAGNEEINVGDNEELFAQVIGSEGDVVASSANVRGEGPVAPLKPGEDMRLDRVAFEDDPFLAVAVALNGSRDRSLIIGASLESVGESTQTVTGLLVVGVPLLLAIVGLVTWRVVGRALAPVEVIRAEVEAISTNELHRRVPEPPRRKDEIGRLATTMNAMLARLERGQERQRRFVSDASHELRSPVSTIRQHAEVALTHPNGTTVDELAEVVLDEDARLQRLVEDLLLLTRMDEGSLPLRAESVDLDDLVFQAAERLRATTGLRVDTTGVSAGRVSGDRSQLRKLVRNLTVNAARHARGAVGLFLRQESREVVLVVDDDGKGIPAEQRERIFERFVRLDEARSRDSGGSGLGLAIVAEIGAAHRATVAVRESPSGGARFEVRFPSAEA